MKSYPKSVYKTTDLIQKHKNAGLVINDEQNFKDALNEIGFYHLRGHSFHRYDISSYTSLGTTILILSVFQRLPPQVADCLQKRKLHS